MVRLHTPPLVWVSGVVTTAAPALGVNRSFRPEQVPLVLTVKLRGSSSAPLPLLALFTPDGVTLAVPTVQTGRAGAVVVADDTFDHGPVLLAATARTRK